MKWEEDILVIADWDSDISCTWLWSRRRRNGVRRRETKWEHTVHCFYKPSTWERLIALNEKRRRGEMVMNSDMPVVCTVTDLLWVFTVWGDIEVPMWYWCQLCPGVGVEWTGRQARSGRKWWHHATDSQNCAYTYLLSMTSYTIGWST